MEGFLVIAVVIEEKESWVLEVEREEMYIYLLVYGWIKAITVTSMYID